MEDVRVYRGAKVTVPATVTDNDGNVVDVTDKTLGFSASETVIGTPTHTISVTPTVNDGPSGLIDIPFVASDTGSLTEADLDGGLLRLRFKLTMADGGGDPVIVATGILHILEAA
jgi:hypothetical protein